MQLDRLMQLILKEAAQMADPKVVNLELIAAAWPALVGPDLATRTKPKAWSHQTLYIEVSSTPWMQELSYRREELIMRIKKLFPWRLERLHLSVSDRFEPLQRREDVELLERHKRREKHAPAPLDAAGAKEAAQDLELLDKDTQALLLKIRQHIQEG